MAIRVGLASQSVNPTAKGEKRAAIHGELRPEIDLGGPGTRLESTGEKRHRHDGNRHRSDEEPPDLIGQIPGRSFHGIEHAGPSGGYGDDEGEMEVQPELAVPGDRLAQ